VRGLVYYRDSPDPSPHDPAGCSEAHVGGTGVASAQDKVEAPTWIAVLVIEGLTAFYRSLAGVGPHVRDQDVSVTRRGPLPNGGMALGQNALVARHGDQA
jgi:hypothetical protein